MINKKYIVLGTLITLTTLSVGGYVMTQNNNSDKTNNEITQNSHPINDIANSLTTEENKKPEQKEESKIEEKANETKNEDSNKNEKEKLKPKEETTKNTQKQVKEKQKDNYATKKKENNKSTSSSQNTKKPTNNNTQTNKKLYNAIVINGHTIKLTNHYMKYYKGDGEIPLNQNLTLMNENYFGDGKNTYIAGHNPGGNFRILARNLYNGAKMTVYDKNGVSRTLTMHLYTIFGADQYGANSDTAKINKMYDEPGDGVFVQFCSNRGMEVWYGR